MKLSSNGETVGVIGGFKVGVHPGSRGKVSHAEKLAVTLEAVP